MNKLTIYLASLTGTLSVFADIPIFIAFGGVFIVVMLEIKKIERKTLPILRNLYGSVITGWATSFGVKHFYPALMEGDVRIFSMLMTTLFAYGIVIYAVKNETIAKWFERFGDNKLGNNNNNQNNQDESNSDN